MADVQTLRIPVEALRAEQGPSGFAALIREEGDRIRRDSFIAISPEQSASGRIMVGYTTIYPGCSTRGHTHPDREEVYFFTRGSGVMIVDGEETEVVAGDTFYLRPGPFHTTRNAGPLPLEYFWTTIVA